MFFRFEPRKSWQEKIFERVFKDRKLRPETLIPFGFIQRENSLNYQTELRAGRFSMEFVVYPDSSTHVELQGANEQENDLLRSSQKSATSFLTRELRKEYEEELWRIAECCFKPDAFKNEITLQLLAHIQAKYGDELEYLWRKFPQNAIVRNQSKKKWYAVFLIVSKSKLTGDSEEKVEALNVRVPTQDLEASIDGISRFPGYHMNKKNWITLCLDGSIPFDELTTRLETSYHLAAK